MPEIFSLCSLRSLWPIVFGRDEAGAEQALGGAAAVEEGMEPRDEFGTPGLLRRLLAWLRRIVLASPPRSAGRKRRWPVK
jgi:hypothetical protein